MRFKSILILAVLLTALSAYAFMPSGKGYDQPLTKALHKTGIKIIDIRTKPEWKQTGIVKGSYTLTFFDEKGRYDANVFLNKLKGIVNKNENFAIICRTGNRTTAVARFLRESGYVKVVNLLGGVVQASENGVEFQPYK